jgi:hypothetical protein
MSRALRRTLILVCVLIAGVVGSVAITTRSEPKRLAPRPMAERPVLLLLTSLPLLFGEAFSLHGGSPALSALETRYRVVPISVTDQGELAKGGLLLMAHPFAQPAEDLVALDAWVRSGGRVLLLADPMLEWPSKRPLGDPLRPPPMFMDTGLLAHWGLRLDAPDERGPKMEKLAGYEVLTDSPGLLTGRCRIDSDGLAADCRLGKGRAIVIADADLLDIPALGAGARSNLHAVLAELALLEQG